jgi:hypothetical protein
MEKNKDYYIRHGMILGFWMFIAIMIATIIALRALAQLLR